MNRYNARVALTFIAMVTLLSVTIAPVAAQGNADLITTGVADTNKAKVGQNIVYTITVTNIGPDTATGVRFGGGLPDQLTPVSLECNEGVNGGETKCSIGDLLPGKTVSAVLVARVCCLPKGETRHTWIEAWAGSDNDPNWDNNHLYTWVKMIGGWNMK